MLSPLSLDSPPIPYISWRRGGSALPPPWPGSASPCFRELGVRGASLPLLLASLTTRVPTCQLADTSERVSSRPHTPCNATPALQRNETNAKPAGSGAHFGGPAALGSLTCSGSAGSNRGTRVVPRSADRCSLPHPSPSAH